MEYTPDNESPPQPQAQPSIPAQHPDSAGNSTFLQQLTDKVREQAQQLQALEAYKTLCEKRILDLSPDHPLPVQPAHLGKSTRNA